MIRLPVLDLSRHTPREQIGVVIKKASDLYDAVNTTEKDIISSECLELIQSALGLLMMIEPNQEHLIKQITRHEQKLIKNDACGEIRIASWLNVYKGKEY